MPCISQALPRIAAQTIAEADAVTWPSSDEVSRLELEDVAVALVGAVHEDLLDGVARRGVVRLRVAADLARLQRRQNSDHMHQLCELKAHVAGP